MKITFLGHAGVLIESGDIRLACDPWFSDRGAFLSGWHQLPDNSAFAPVLDTATHVYVSHDHQDHFDFAVLAGLPPSVPLIMPNYPLPSWHRLVASLPNPTIILLDDDSVLNLGALRLRLMVSPTPRHQDSALLVEEESTGQVVVNLNDCQVGRDQLGAIAARYPRIDAVLAQFSGATWFPFVYAFPAAERAAAAAQKKLNSMRRWAHYMRALQPRTAVAFAGPPALLDPTLAPYFRGDSSVFTTPVELQEWLRREQPDLAARCIAPLPGDALDVATAEAIPDAGIREQFGWDRVDEYLLAYAERRGVALERELALYPEPQHDLFDDFAAGFEALFDVAEKACREVDAVVGFEIIGAGGGSWLVDFRELRVIRSAEPDEITPDYRFTLASRFLPPILRGELSWEEFFFSFRFRAWRPSIGSYNEALMSILRCSAPDDLAEYLRQVESRSPESSGTFRLDTRHGTFLVADTCPHLGTKLAAQDYDPEHDAVVCPQHGWCFEVPTGHCRNGRAQLDMTRIDDDSVDGE